MNECVLKTVNLKKIYKQTPALDNISVTIERGKIYGFIGQNGAGKTTMMRIITGLAFPTEGELELFGEVSRKGLENARKRMGCTIEHAAMYPNLTATENLELQKVLRNVSDKGAIERVLKTVGLSDTGNKKFKDFSMGMKQRLGIAAALICNPELLILDEPINGLDPMGIVEVREMLVRLNKENNITILISSHILSELFMLATDYIIIHKGKIVDRLTQEQLIQKCRKHIIIEASNVEQAKSVLKNKLNTANFIVMKDNKIKLFDHSYDRKVLANAFYDTGVLLTELSYSEESLESYFIHTIGGGSGGCIS